METPLFSISHRRRSEGIFIKKSKFISHQEFTDKAFNDWKALFMKFHNSFRDSKILTGKHKIFLLEWIKQVEHKGIFTLSHFIS